MIKFTKYLLLALVICFTLPSYAVTDKEMEEARTIAAKLYLRWSNDASGYLDDVSVKTMSQLEASLKPKEKENLKAFKAVKVPSDYASWDKARLVEFWGVTFFTSPGLSDNGKRAKGRVKNKVQAMKVSAPEPPKTEPAPAPAAENPAPAETPAATPAAPASTPSADVAAAEQQDILADQTAIARDEAEARDTEPRQKRSNGTWVYVAILVVLVGVVIWLMVFAANMLKKQTPEESDAALAADNDRLSKSEQAAKTKLADTEQRMKALEESNAELKREISRLTKSLEDSRASEERLRADLASAKAAKAAAAAMAPPAPQTPVREQPVRKPVINEIYLGRANAKGQFVRGDRRPVAGNTVFRLDTADGMVGTFRVADNADTLQLALSNPLQYLTGACNSDNYADAATATRIITEDPGTAILEGGCWKVLRKSRIRFE